MNVAVIGPVVKDTITVDGETKVQIGGIPYYQAVALRRLGAKVTAFLTYGTRDVRWVKQQFHGIRIVHLPTSATLEFARVYSRKNPDACISVKIHHAKNTVRVTPDLLRKLKRFDWVLFGPLLYDNIPISLFRSLRGKKLVLGNFGMFSHAHRGKLIYANPAKFFKVLPLLTYLFIDRKEAQFLSKQKDILAAGRFLIKKGLRHLIITLGSKGSVIFDRNKSYRIPAYKPARIADPTGAGDTYAAAFIRSTELFKNPIQQGKFAAMAATIKIESRGAFRSTLQKIVRRIKSEK